MFNIHHDVNGYEIVTFPLDAVKAAMGDDVDEFVRRGARVLVLAPGGRPIPGRMESGIGKGVSFVLPPGSQKALATRYVTEAHFCHLELVGRLTLDGPPPTLRIMGVPAVADPEQRTFIVDMATPGLMFEPVASAHINSTDAMELTQLGFTDISSAAHVGPNATCQRHKVRIWENSGFYYGLKTGDRVYLVMRDKNHKDGRGWSEFEATVDMSGTKSFTLDSGDTGYGRPPIVMEERLKRAGGKWGNVGEWRTAKLPTTGPLARAGLDKYKRVFVYTAYGPPVLNKEQSEFLWEAMSALPSDR